MTYKDELKSLAEYIKSDGCTYVPNFYEMCCHEHDWNLAMGKTPRGVEITTKEAHQRFRDCIQANSPLRFLSPMSWWRWLAVNIWGSLKPDKPPVIMDYTVGKQARLIIVSELLEKT